MEVSIATARGIALAATLGVPDTADPLDLPALGAALEDGRKAPDRSEGLVILAHNFLTDRHGLAHRLDDMAARYGTLVGLSDHTLDNTTAIVSIALGACVIEKHFTLDRNGGGADDSFSLEPADLAALCRDSRTAWQALGRVEYGLKSSEQGNAQFRRSLYFVRDMKAGDIIDETCIRSVRPGYGLPPKCYDDLIGKRVTRDIAANTKTSWDCIEAA